MAWARYSGTDSDHHEEPPVHRPRLRLSAPRPQTEGVPPTPPGAAEKAQRLTEAGARKWKEPSRKNESRMAENAEKRGFMTAQEQGKSERPEGAGGGYERWRTRQWSAEVMSHVASGAPAYGTRRSSEEELRASAERLSRAWERRFPARPRLTVEFGGINAVAKLTRRTIASTSPSESQGP